MKTVVFVLRQLIRLFLNDTMVSFTITAFMTPHRLPSCRVLDCYLICESPIVSTLCGTITMGFLISRALQPQSPAARDIHFTSIMFQGIFLPKMDK